MKIDLNKKNKKSKENNKNQIIKIILAIIFIGLLVFEFKQIHYKSFFKTSLKDYSEFSTLNANQKLAIGTVYIRCQRNKEIILKDFLSKVYQKIKIKTKTKEKNSSFETYKLELFDINPKFYSGTVNCIILNDSLFDMRGNKINVSIINRNDEIIDINDNKKSIFEKNFINFITFLSTLVLLLNIVFYKREQKEKN